MTLTPGETSRSAGDLVTKAANVNIGFLDRLTGAFRRELKLILKDEA